MAFSRRRIASCFASALTIAFFAVAAGWPAHADDYVRDKSPSPSAKAYFAAVPDKLPVRKVSRNETQKDGDGEAYFTEDGSISIPPRGMVAFKMAGRCMDPHLPAPASGEPMQFVDASKLIPEKLRGMYDNLIRRQTQGDPRVLKNNPQHLVWAIRTAGTDDPLANNLSESQLEVLDECAGRRGAFMKYHEKMKKRNARKNRKRAGDSGGGNRVSVGGLSYDASDLRGTNAVRRIESHISTLTEMGEKSRERTASDFRYGEIEEELYSDIACDGGLSFTARILNASEHRKEFRAADFVAQVGNGRAKGGMRQRVTMGTPDEIMVVAGALREGVEIDRDVSIAEVDGEATQRLRGRAYRRRTARGGEGHTRTERETERTRRTKRDEHTTVTEVTPVQPVTPVTPVEPVRPVVIHDTVTNVVERPVPVAEEVKVRVLSLEYDAATHKGVLTVEIISGSFKEANEYIRKNFDDLVRKHAHFKSDIKLPPAAKFEIESISINDSDRCEVKFVVKGREG